MSVVERQVTFTAALISEYAMLSRGNEGSRLYNREQYATGRIDLEEYERLEELRIRRFEA